VRNRLRRQLRHALADEARLGGLPAGWYLVGAGPAATGLSAAGLRAAVHDVVEGIRAGGGS
jgi:RNase P protein component